MLASEWCPLRQREWFRAGTEPTAYCPEHTSPPDSDDSIGDRIVQLLKGIFNFSPASTWLEVLVWTAYVIPVAYLFFRPARPSKPTPVTASVPQATGA